MTPVVETRAVEEAVKNCEKSQNPARPVELLTPEELHRRVARLRAVLLAELTPEDMAGIMRALINKACEGHVQAGKLVLAYTLGKPTAFDPAADPGAPESQPTLCQPVPRCDTRPSPDGDLSVHRQTRERDRPGNFFVDLDLVPPVPNGKIKLGSGPASKDGKQPPGPSARK